MKEKPLTPYQALERRYFMRLEALAKANQRLAELEAENRSLARPNKLLQAVVNDLAPVPEGKESK